VHTSSSGLSAFRCGFFGVDESGDSDVVAGFVGFDHGVGCDGDAVFAFEVVAPAAAVASVSWVAVAEGEAASAPGFGEVGGELFGGGDGGAGGFGPSLAEGVEAVDGGQPAIEEWELIGFGVA
jgi:hypothetical protein